MNVEDLIAAGTHKWCPDCNAAVIPVGKPRCNQCALRPTPITPPRQPAAATPAGKHLGAHTHIRPEALADLQRFDDLTVWIVAAGKPVTQGSMKAVAPGVMKHSKSKELHTWRDSLTREALRITQGKWQALNLPVRLDVVLTVPKPKTTPRWSPLVCDDGAPRIPPMTPPDVDKLLRAVQDSLSPRDDKKKAEHTKTRDRRFRLLEDDSRIVDSSARKTFPTPHHTHPWALPFPGAVIRLSPLGQEVDPLPTSTLSAPGDLPEAAELLLDKLRQRTGR